MMLAGRLRQFIGPALVADFVFEVRDQFSRGSSEKLLLQFQAARKAYIECLLIQCVSRASAPLTFGAIEL